ncbi:hypothetical protein [Roseateles sp.]|uniref:hypothetical protein n=1 Tax=Roseateles sp. TaxID=1971397 RepID=UPI003BACD491
MKSLVLREFAHRTEQRNRANEAGIRAAAVMLSLSFRDTSSQHVFYDHREQSHDELLSALVVSHNRQYQWLLAEVFEHFEDFMTDAYGCAGAIDSTIWSSKDLTSIGGHAGMPTSWWIEKARGLRGMKATVAASRLRAFPGISQVESRNALAVDLKVVLFLVERMRHLIVHRRGQASSADDFAEGIARDAGLAAPTQEIRDLVGQYFGNGRLNTTIHLLDHQLLPSDDGFNWHVEKFDQLLGWLLAYAHMVSARL